MNTGATIVSFWVTVLVLFAKTTCGCGGFNLEVQHFRNCKSDSVIEISKNFSVVMTHNCLLLFTGCITIRDTITRAEVEYTFHKDLMKRTGKKDGCNQLVDNKLMGSDDIGIDVLGLPKKCPIEKGVVCVDNKSINVNKYKLQLSAIAGQFKGKILVTTNIGKACLEFSVKLVNTRAKSFPVIGIVG